jgi:small subunit ribosomal protein S4
MARYIGAVCRLCRREGEKLFLKGPRCTSVKCAITKKAYAPGQHGKNKPKLSNYGLQLREKQKVKRMYGVLERQFRRYFKISSKTKGVTGRLLLQYLERRLDNVTFRLGFAVSRSQGRQIVRHNLIYVNAKRVNIPSYLVDKDDVITVKNNEKIHKNIRENMQLAQERSVPGWLELNSQDLKAKVLRLPEKEDIPSTIQEQLIVELYSK